MNTSEAFWSRAKQEPTSGCWLWTGAYRKGYGFLNVYPGGRHTTMGAHRRAWELAMGPIPEGMCVLHQCDVPPCINPAHLFLGSQADNMADAVAKGRFAMGSQHRATGSRHRLNLYPETRLCGEDNPSAKLRAMEVEAIRSRPYSGRGHYSRLAREFNVTPHVIIGIVRGTSWRQQVSA